MCSKITLSSYDCVRRVEIMANSLKNLTSILLLLFLAPIIIATVQTPLLPQQKLRQNRKEEKRKVTRL